MSELHVTAPLSQSEPVPTIRAIGLADLRHAFARGVDDFQAMPTQLVFLGLLYPVIGLVAARAATGSLMPLIFPLLTGLSLMGPVVALGMYEISRQREAGRPVAWNTAFGVLRSPAIGGIVILGALLLIVFGVWIAAAQSLYGAIMGPDVPASLSAFMGRVLHTAEGHRLIVVGNLIGAIFAAFVLTTSVISFPMILDRVCSPALAIRTSVLAVLRNPATMALWGLLVAGSLAIGCIPALLGLAVVMPVLGHATWHLYRRVVA
ncbi:MAG: DUF2189 domain-containing protein [Acetobacteraceae bacterium]